MEGQYCFHLGTHGPTSPQATGDRVVLQLKVLGYVGEMMKWSSHRLGTNGPSFRQVVGPRVHVVLQITGRGFVGGQMLMVNAAFLLGTCGKLSGQ